MIPKNATPAERILASLDEESSEEDYSASQIELLPTAQIEGLALEHVTRQLDNAGLNYLAGLERVRELVGAPAKPTSHAEKRKIFERHFLFGKLNANEIDALISYARVERYRAGSEIFAKGSPGQSLMAVLRGSVKISSLSDSGKEIVFTIFNVGDIFGEIAVLDGEERSADATALTDCELLVLNRRDLLPVLQNRVDLCIILLKILCRRLRLTTGQVEDIIFRHLESRVAKALVQLAESVSLHGVRNPSVELHVSQRELGNMAGGSRESVNKQLQIWHRQGLIDLRKGSIMIHDIEAMRRLIAKGIGSAELGNRTPFGKGLVEGPRW